MTIKACLDAKCEKFLASDKAAEGKTSEEVWQVQGKGTTYETATKLVDDGNTKAYPVVYGDWAGKDLAGKIQLYYDPISGNEKGAKIGTMSAAKIEGLASIMPLKSLSGFGLIELLPTTARTTTEAASTRHAGSTLATSTAAKDNVRRHKFGGERRHVSSPSIR